MDSLITSQQKLEYLVAKMQSANDKKNEDILRNTTASRRGLHRLAKFSC